MTHFRSVWIWEHKLHGQKLVSVVFSAPFFSAFVLAELSLRSRQDDQLQGQAHILPTSKPPREEQLGLSICIKQLSMRPPLALFGSFQTDAAQTGNLKRGISLKGWPEQGLQLPHPTACRRKFSQNGLVAKCCSGSRGALNRNKGTACKFSPLCCCTKLHSLPNDQNQRGSALQGSQLVQEHAVLSLLLSLSSGRGYRQF